MELVEFVDKILKDTKGKILVTKAINILCYILNKYANHISLTDSDKEVAKYVISKEFAEFIVREYGDKSNNIIDYSSITLDDIRLLGRFVKGEFDTEIKDNIEYNSNKQFMGNAKLIMSYEIASNEDEDTNEDDVDDIFEHLDNENTGEEDIEVTEDDEESAEDIFDEIEKDNDSNNESEETEENTNNSYDSNNSDEVNDNSNNKLDDSAILKWKSTIETAVRYIMEVYSNIYASCYEIERPLGILYGDGIITKQGNMPDMSLSRFYTDIQNIMGIQIISSDKCEISVEDINRGVNYLPRFQLDIALGIKGNQFIRYWDEYKVYLEDRVRNIFIGLYTANPNLNQRESDIINSKLQAILTNTILVNEFEINISAKFKIKFDNKFLSKVTKSSIESAIANGLFSKYGTVSLVSDIGKCKKVNIVFDKSIDSGKPIFAYKIYEYYKEKGIKPDWSRIILGKDVTNDEIFTMDLASNMNFNTFIGAGPRSGKGVMTLNILASAISLGIPVFYADCKPEMSICVKQLAEKYGSPYVSIDTNSGIEKEFKINNNVPSELSFSRNLGGYIMYSKLMQIMTVISDLRAAEYRFDSCDNNQRLLFILDETKGMFDMVESINAFIKEVIQKDSSYDDTTKEYVKSVINWGSVVSGSVTSSLVSSLPKSKINLITLAQKLNIGDWDSDNSRLKLPFIGMVKSSTINKLIGNGSSGTTMGFKASAPNSEIANAYINRDYRCFANYGSVLAPVDNKELKVFKPYLVIPSVDMNTSLGIDSFGELVKSYEKFGNVKELYNSDGTPIECLSLEGIIKIVDSTGSVVKKSFGYAYDIAYEVLDKAGLMDKYSSVPYGRKVIAYLHDNSIDTLKSTGEMLDYIIDNKSNGGLGDDYINDRVDSGNMDRIHIDDEMFRGDNSDDTEVKYTSNSKSFSAGNDGTFYKYEDTDKDEEENVLKDNITKDRGKKYINPERENINVLKGMKKYISMNSKHSDIYRKEMTKILCKEVICNELNGVNRNMVRSMIIYDNALYINGKEVVLNYVLETDKDYQLDDIIDYTYIVKYFKELKKLTISRSVAYEFCMQHGIRSISDTGNIYKNLVEFYVTDGNNTTKIFDRTEDIFKTDKEEVRRIDKDSAIKNTVSKKRNKSSNSRKIATSLGYGALYLGKSIASKFGELIMSFRQ